MAATAALSSSPSFPVQYHTPDGAFFLNCGPGTAPDYTLADLQAVGQEEGSRVVRGYDAAALLAQAAAMLC